MSKKNVLFIIPSLVREGAQTQLVDLVNAIPREKFNIHLFTFEKEIDQQERLKSHIRFYNQPRRYKYDLIAAFTIARIIDRENIDLVHCTLQFALLFGWIGVVRSARKPPLVNAIHTTINRNGKDEFLDRILYRWLMKNCASVVCVCESQRIHWERKYPVLRSKTKVIYNGVDTLKFDRTRFILEGKKLRIRLGIGDYTKIIGSIAAFRPEKGHRILLRAFSKVKNKLPQVQMLLAGDGPLRREIETYALQLGLEGSVHFLGSVNDIRPVLAAVDVSVIASTAVETFSMAMLESMAMEVPLVAADIGGTAEAVVNNKSGVIVPVGDANKLAEGLLLLLRHDESRRAMGRCSRALVEKKYTRLKMISEMSSLIMTVAY